MDGVHQLRVIPRYPYPNWREGQNDCHVTVATNDSRTKLLIVMAQRLGDGEILRGTSVINQAETIIELIAKKLLPDIINSENISSKCEIIWVVEMTFDDDMYDTRKILHVDFPKLSILEKLRGVKKPLQMSFGPPIDADDYARLLGENHD